MKNQAVVVGGQGIVTIEGQPGFALPLPQVLIFPFPFVFLLSLRKKRCLPLQMLPPRPFQLSTGFVPSAILPEFLHPFLILSFFPTDT